MPYPEAKSENYSNLGGINTKVSPYDNGPAEFLKVFNLDLFIPGALTSRPGSTAYLSAQSFTTPMTGLYEFSLLGGQSFPIMTGGSWAFMVQNNVGITFQSGLGASNQYNFVTFVDRLFAANGVNFFKFGGNTFPYLYTSGFTFTLGSTATITGFTVLFNSTIYSLPQAGNTVVVPGAIWQKLSLDPQFFGFATLFPVGVTFSYSYAYLNNRGFEGPASSPVFFVPGASVYAVQVYDSLFSGGEAFSFPASYGIGFTVGFSPDARFSPSHVIYAGGVVYRDNGPGTSRFRVGYIELGTSQSFQNAGFFLDRYDNTNGGSLINVDFTDLENSCIGAGPAPKYLELFQNQLFSSGYTNIPSTVYFSDIGEPESIQPESTFEVRTNDGDRILGFKAFQNSMLIFKTNSFHVLNGTDGSNFVLRQLSDQYGCLSSRAAVVYETTLLFLDKKGICVYNGANIEILSTKMEPIFRRMNIQAAIDHAQGFHYKDRNQIWFAIPVDGSTQNNLTVIYDYLANAFSVHEGYFPSVMAIMTADKGRPTPFYGSYSGMIHNFSPSLFSDNGQGISYVSQSRFIADSGQSVQKLYRQLFTNVKSGTNATMNIMTNFYKDFGTSSVLSVTQVINPGGFQNRIDFGISVKSISVEIGFFSATDSITYHGFALSSRFLRNV